MKKKILKLFIFSIILSCSKDDSPPPDTIAPQVEFEIPGIINTQNEVPLISTSLEISIDAIDAGGIAKIEAFLDNNKAGEDTSAPYNIIIDVTAYDTKQYKLRISATDKAGNESSTEKDIFIDNELPAITNVSLEQGAIIAGNENELTFDVSDNHELQEILVLLNGESYADVTDSDYIVNIDASVLEDGNNDLKITAKDITGNIVEYDISFISDNTGPSINIEGIEDGLVIDELFNLSPEVSDEYSSVASVDILYNDVSLQLFENTTDINLDFNPDNYDVGAGSFTITATDDLGNTSEEIIAINVFRRLLTINIPENVIANANDMAWVFLSNMDGSLITAKEMTNDNQIILNTSIEFDTTTEFMMTFYTLDNGGFSRVVTFQNLTRQNPGILSLKTPDRRSGGGQQSLSATGFDDTDWVSGDGLDYSVNYNSDSVSISKSVSSTNDSASDEVYIYAFNPNSKSYAYQILTQPISDDFIVDKTNFITDNIENKSLTISSSAASNSIQLRTWGYKSLDDFQNNLSHMTFNYSDLLAAEIPFEYSFNNSFEYNKHFLFMGNYYTEQLNAPLNEYVIPEWTIDYSISGNIINIDLEGSGHVLGKIHLEDFESSNPNYFWNISFDSQNTTSIVIPELPEEISGSNIGILHESTGFKVSRAEIGAYSSTILNYDEYIQKIVKENKEVLEVSDKLEFIYNAELGSQGPTPDFFFK